MSSAEQVDTDWKTLFRAGGVSWIIVGVFYIIEIPMFFLLGPALQSPDAALKNLAGLALIAQVTVGIAILSHLFSVPGVLALYHSMKQVNRSAMLVAAAFLSAFIILDMAVPTPNLLSLISLSQNYQSLATSDAQRLAYLATATYSFGLFSATTPIYGSLVPSVGVLLTGLTMRNGVFSRGVAYLGIAAGVIGIVAGLAFAIPALTFLDVGNLILFGIWLIFVGLKIYKIGTTIPVRGVR